MTAEKLSPWQERTIERNLIDAKRRLLTKSTRFVQAARSLLDETGSLDFTVQEVVERSKLSLRGFYQSFASKDDLLLALFEEYMATGAEMQRRMLARIDDPLERIHKYLSSYWDTAQDPRVTRALVHYHLNLAMTRPTDLRHALEPGRALLGESVSAAIAAGRVRSDIAPERLTEILMATAITALHTQVTHSNEDLPGQMPGEIWMFCLSGISPA
jgi:AcrR family transcriptional regulator